MRCLLVAALLVVAACDSSPPAPPVVVYVPAPLEESVRQWLEEGGFPAEMVVGDSDELTDTIIAKRDVPRADVLVTSSVIDIWRAGDEGALRPLDGAVTEGVPAALRDPDGAWVALGSQPILIGIVPGVPGPPIATYADLASPAMAGSLCVTTSAAPRNRVLIAMLIEELGVRQAERMVRAWMRNLARAPFATERELAKALASGACKVAILSANVEVPGLERVAPVPTYRDVQGIGVTRHAGHPEQAQRLVAWLSATAAANDPVVPDARNAGAAGWRDEEARLLAQRAGYR